MEIRSTSLLGPFGWPKFENAKPPLPDMFGVYLMTVTFQDGFLPFGVGITRRPVRKRFMEHTRSFASGEYNILSLTAAQSGIREIVWKGWGWTPEKRADFENRKTEIVASAHKILSATNIFVFEIPEPKRALERAEAAIANNYYETEYQLIDKGMLLMPRWENEEPIGLKFCCDSILYGMPEVLEI